MKKITSLVPALALVTSALVAAVAAPADAAVPNCATVSQSGKTALVVLGTSDVQDSCLMAQVIEPAFEAAYPQYDLQYVGNATDAAIAAAEQGAGAALIVHAMSLENQFVADGFSKEPFGRALFWGDFVLAGPKGDPAHVLDGSTHDIVTAFEKIAAAGADGDATFVSRGGGPGTTVQEHQLWALADPTALSMCNVSSANGGGKSPYQNADPATGNCPDNIGKSVNKVAQDSNDPGFPTWYVATGQTQAPNVNTANSCTSGGMVADGCYVFTDRGTYQFLASNTPSDGWNLQVVTKDNEATARGGIPALANSFHGYVINPDQESIKGQPGLKTDVTGGTLFLNFLTSPEGQALVGAYQNPDPSFLPSARPQVTVSRAPAAVKGGQQVTITGTLANVVPGMPALSGVPVSLTAARGAGPGITPETVATAVTDAAGRFTLSYAPRATQIYTVTTGQITKLEATYAGAPSFSDILQPTSTPVGATTVLGTVTLKPAKTKRHKVTVKGTVAPAAADAQARVAIYVHKAHRKAKLKKTLRLTPGATAFTGKINLKKGTWKIHVVYSDGSAVTAATSNTRKARVR